jgi:hypothetical protein
MKSDIVVVLILIALAVGGIMWIRLKSQNNSPE